MLRPTIVFLVVLKCVAGANILFLSLLPAMQHHVWNEAVVQALLSNGHNITLLSHVKTNLNLPNYTVLEIEGFGQNSSQDSDAASLFKLNSIQSVLYLWDFNLEICEYDFRSPTLRDLLKYPQDSFELIIFDLNAGQCLYPLIEFFGNPPVVGVSPFGIPPVIADAMGNHIYPYIPFYTLPYSDRMSFLQRFHNVFLQMLENVVKWCFYMPDFYKKAQTFFGEDIRYFHQVERSIELLLTNNDPAFDFPQPFPPNIIPVGGLHIEATKPLSHDLGKIFDDSPEGVIYFSFGTVKAEFLSGEIKNVLLSAFGRLNQTVLWNFPEEGLDVPANVIVRKWFPQNDILGHPNTRLFITHGDTLSVQEAMYHGVPVVGIPLFGDQHGNLAKIVNKNLGKKLNYLNLDASLLLGTILEVLYNPTYTKNSKDLSKKFKDRPQSPSDRAVFWIEYTLRNKNLSHLNIGAKYMHFYETMSLDVIFAAMVCVCLYAYAVHTIYQLIIYGTRNQTREEQGGIKVRKKKKKLN